MEKKCFVALLMVVVMMCACWTGAVADEERKTFTSGDYQYALLDDGTVEITKYNGKAEDLIIADTLEGKKVTSIGDRAFFWCPYLTSVTIPNSVTSIGDRAFYWSSLSFVTIPDSVVQIGVNPFEYCFALKSISVSPDNPYFAVIDGVLFRKADKCLISYPIGIKSSTYTIPQGITSIGDSAFRSCSFLSSVTIPDSVISIGALAFYNCASLDNITIPDSVISIGDSAFSVCDSLTSVSFPDSVASIGEIAFFGCLSLTNVAIPDSVIFIGDDAFSGCPNLTLTVPRNSYAAEYAKTNNIPYTYPDANDWLNN